VQLLGVAEGAAARRIEVESLVPAALVIAQIAGRIAVDGHRSLSLG
jgi:hypothetical protein